MNYEFEMSLEELEGVEAGPVDLTILRLCGALRYEKGLVASLKDRPSPLASGGSVVREEVPKEMLDRIDPESFFGPETKESKQSREDTRNDPLYDVPDREPKTTDKPTKEELDRLTKRPRPARKSQKRTGVVKDGYASLPITTDPVTEIEKGQSK